MGEVQDGTAQLMSLTVRICCSRIAATLTLVLYGSHACVQEKEWVAPYRTLKGAALVPWLALQNTGD
jgi:hypothetical protein